MQNYKFLFFYFPFHNQWCRKRVILSLTGAEHQLLTKISENRKRGKTPEHATGSFVTLGYRINGKSMNFSVSQD